MNPEQIIRTADLTMNPLGEGWTDGLFTGNGRIAAILSGKRELEWTINHVEVYQGLPTDCNFYPHSEVVRRFDSGEERDTHWMEEQERDRNELNKTRHTVTPVQLRLKSYHYFGWGLPPLPVLSGKISLYDALVTANAESDTRSMNVQSFTPYGTNTLCLRLTIPEGQVKLYTWEFVRPDDYAMELPALNINGNELSMVQRFEGEDESYAVVCRFQPCEGQVSRFIQEGNFIAVQTTGDCDVFLSIATSRKGKDPLANARMQCIFAAETGFDILYRRHTAYWHDFWKKNCIRFDSCPEISRRVLFSQYVLGCTFAGTPMPALSGLSYGPLNSVFAGCYSPWYTHDQNVQIALMGCMPSNRWEMVDVMADTYLEILPVLQEYTKKVHETDGVCLALNLLQNGYARGGEYRYTLCGSAYSGMVLVMAWRYGRDKQRLKEKYYPLLKEFIRFYVGIMPKGKDGIYHLDPNIPPEIFSLTRDDTCTLALLKPCLETAIEASKLFGVDAEEAKIWRDILAHYPPLAKRSDGGWWCGSDIPEDHYMYGGHLFYPFFPSEVDTDEETARKTLEYHAIHGVEKDAYGNPECGWSLFNAGVTRLRLGGAEAFHAIYEFIDLFGKGNGLFHHNAIDPGRTPNPDAKRLVPTVIEGTAAVLFMACEALLQTRHGVVTLFPNVPANFTGGFEHLRTVQGLDVSAEMTAGRVTACSVTASVPVVLRLRLPNSDTVTECTLNAGKTVRIL